MNVDPAHSVLRETKMFKNSYIIGIDVEIRLVCLHRCNIALGLILRFFFWKKIEDKRKEKLKKVSLDGARTLDLWLGMPVL